MTTGAPFAAVWAAAPDALVYATRNGSSATALVQLSQPAYDAESGRLTFAVRMLPADAAQLATAGGVTARVRLLPACRSTMQPVLLAASPQPRTGPPGAPPGA